MTITDAQQDMRHAYFGGATGLLASACVWLAAGVFAVARSPTSAVVALLVGGMMIHPLAILLSKALGRPGSHKPGNPLGRLALEGTVFFLLGIPLACVVSRFRIEWFFPAMLLLIGGRYLTFATVYGLRHYWVCGATLAAAAFLLVALGGPVAAGALAGALVESGFALAVFAAARTRRPAA